MWGRGGGGLLIGKPLYDILYTFSNKSHLDVTEFDTFQILSKSYVIIQNILFSRKSIIRISGSLKKVK